MITERAVFSAVGKNILTDRRASLTSHMFECLTLLKMNRKLWDLDEVARAIKMQQHGEMSAEEAADYEANKDVVDEVVE